MKKWQRTVLTLISCTLNGEKPQAGIDMDLRVLSEFCISQQIFGLIYRALEMTDDFYENCDFDDIKTKTKCFTG